MALYQRLGLRTLAFNSLLRDSGFEKTGMNPLVDFLFQFSLKRFLVCAGAADDAACGSFQFSLKRFKFALAKVNEMIDALPFNSLLRDSVRLS